MFVRSLTFFTSDVLLNFHCKITSLAFKCVQKLLRYYKNRNRGQCSIVEYGGTKWEFWFWFPKIELIQAFSIKGENNAKGINNTTNTLASRVQQYSKHQMNKKSAVWGWERNIWHPDTRGILELILVSYSYFNFYFQNLELNILHEEKNTRTEI